ncbi:MAG: TraR/DksA family transcriptional regulator [Candidatus Babeliales bacterium]
MKQRAELIERIKKTLLKRKDDIETQLSRQTHEKVTDGVVQDTADEVQSLSMQNLQSSIQRTEIDELHLMEDALGRIERGEYGICVDCGEPISEKRLESFPYAARCIICQEAFEQ